MSKFLTCWGSRTTSGRSPSQLQHEPYSREAPWLDAFKGELKAFPMGRHDDQVDSFSQFVRYQLRKWKWVITQYDQRGRGDLSMRMRNRPW